MITRVNECVALPVRNMERARTFYRDVLGLPVALDEEDFVLFDPGGCHLALHLRPTPMPAPDPLGPWIWLEVDEIEGARARPESSGVEFMGEKRFLGPGWDQAFLDTEGNVLRLWERLREVRKNIFIRASAKVVLAALTTPAIIQEWFPAIDDVVFEGEAGGRVSFVDPLFGRVTGTVEEMVPGQRLALRFYENWPRHLVFELTRKEGGVRLDVHQTGFDQIGDREERIHLEVENLEMALAFLKERLER